MRELLVILPTVNTLIRFENEGLIQLSKEEAKRGVKIRMLIQRTEASINDDNTNDNKKDGSVSNEKKILQEFLKDRLIEVQYLNKLSNSRSITIISDTTFSFVIEVNNDTAQTTNEAIGLATYSNSENY